MKENYNNSQRGNGWALLPLGVFLLMYLVPSIITKDFYKMPISVSFLVASFVAIAINPKEKIPLK